MKTGEGLGKLGSKVKNRNNVVSPITRKLYAEIQYFFEKEFVEQAIVANARAYICMDAHRKLQANTVH